MDINIEPSWKNALGEEFSKPYFEELTRMVREAYHVGTPVFPPQENIFKAFTLCPFDDVRVVILGQDPYHGKGQAHGLSFSVQNNIKIPPSLQNIYKEIASDIGTVVHDTGDLTEWAKQGVLLLNATLTVEEGKPMSHKGLGWETFTDSIIEIISSEKEHVVFLLWGKHAQDKGARIDGSKHLVLKAPHPSPFSVHTGFFGCKHFSETNTYLEKQHLQPILW